MTSRRCALVTALALSFLAPASHAWSQPTVEILGGTADETTVSPDGRAVHRASGFEFPLQLGDMPLRKLKVYGAGDVSADYSLRGGGNGDAWITFFVYPATGSMDEEVAGIEQALIQNMAATPISAPAGLPASFAGGRSGWFNGNLKGTQLTTGYMVVRRGHWLLKARFSIPNQEGLSRTIVALTLAPWSWRSPHETTADTELVR